MNVMFSFVALGFHEFAGDLQCDGVGIAHSLSVFNLFFGLLCLCVPGLLVTLILYFNKRSTAKFRDLQTIMFT